jgi:predicted metal-dependent phosphoesterase TrpH
MNVKIDLHCHTKKIKSGDAETRAVVTPELFKIKIENADIKIVAITNQGNRGQGCCLN